MASKKKYQDHYFNRAKKDGFPARSVYKLQEIQNKFKLIKKGNRVLDLGCFPGSWLLYAADQAGKTGHIVGIDLKPVKIKIPSNTIVYTGDILSSNGPSNKLEGQKFNNILSDMAPSTSGNKFLDSARSLDLCIEAFSIVKKLLIPGGSFVCKIFQGEGVDEFVDLVKILFAETKYYKPKSSKKASKEIYIIGKRKKIITKQEAICQGIVNGQQ